MRRSYLQVQYCVEILILINTSNIQPPSIFERNYYIERIMFILSAQVIAVPHEVPNKTHHSLATVLLLTQIIILYIPLYSFTAASQTTLTRIYYCRSLLIVYIIHLKVYKALLRDPHILYEGTLATHTCFWAFWVLITI